jgi:hypothetical protein
MEPRYASGWAVMGHATNVVKLRGGDTEKVTINVGVVDLGQIDLLVQE